MGRAMLRRVCFLACLLSPVITGTSIHSHAPSKDNRNSVSHLIRRREAQAFSLESESQEDKLDFEVNVQHERRAAKPDVANGTNNYPLHDPSNARSAQPEEQSIVSSRIFNNPHGESMSIADAMALAEAGNRYPNPKNPSLGSNYISSSQATAKAESSASVAQEMVGNIRNSNYPTILALNSAADFSHANTNSYAASGLHSLANDNGRTKSRYFSRVIPNNEYILPHQISGGSGVQCNRPGELHYFWSEDYDCLVCVCHQDLTAICASCSGCVRQPVPSPPLHLPRPVPQPLPLPPLLPIQIQPSIIPPQPPNSLPPTPPTFPIPPPAPSVPVPAPQPFLEATCNPLPSNQPFQNPLNPCQICICKAQVDIFGKPQVEISCHENPQCVLPPVPIPPIPEPPVPIPLPLCDKFPVDVLFPHPTDVCMTCKCVVVPNALVPVKHLACFQNAQCESPKLEPTPVPVPEPGPSPPSLPPPEITLPFVPGPKPPVLPVINPEGELPPGPLPGPSPHESCRPYPPNQPFQHPWDECQVCVCTEGYALNQVIVEVNCFTKKMCCREYAQQSQALSLPYYPTAGSNIAEASIAANAQSGLIPYIPALSYGGPQSATANAQAVPSVAVLPVQGSLTEADITAAVNAAINTFGTITDADANAVANSVLFQPTQPGSINLHQIRYNPNYNQGGLSTGADASVYQQVNPANYVNYAPYTPGYQGQSTVLPIQNSYAVSDANALANAGYSLPSYYGHPYHNIRPGVDTLFPTGNYIPGYSYPDATGQGSAYGQGGYNQYTPGNIQNTATIIRPSIRANYEQLAPESSAFSKANVPTSADPLNTSNQNYFGNLAQAESNALPEEYMRQNQGLLPTYGSKIQAQPQAQAKAQASPHASAVSAIKSADPDLMNEED